MPAVDWLGCIDREPPDGEGQEILLALIIGLWTS